MSKVEKEPAELSFTRLTESTFQKTRRLKRESVPEFLAWLLSRRIIANDAYQQIRRLSRSQRDARLRGIFNHLKRKIELIDELCCETVDRINRTVWEEACEIVKSSIGVDISEPLPSHDDIMAKILEKNPNLKERIENERRCR